MGRPPLNVFPEAFVLLPDEDFEALTFVERIEYLRQAVHLRNAINRQVDATLHDYPGHTQSKPN